MFGWGYNLYTQATADNTAGLAQFPTPTKFQLNALGGSETVTDIATMQYNTVVLSSSGTVYVVGRNNYGQIGDGTTNDRYV
jgi:alpha-tubulin suppressor-like RCC1 family protein